MALIDLKNYDTSTYLNIPSMKGITEDGRNWLKRSKQQLGIHLNPAEFWQFCVY